MSEQTTPAFRIPQFTAADRCRKARESVGLSQVELAERIGVSKNTVSNYETGATTHLRRIVVGQWAWATGVPREWLSDGVEPVDHPPEGGDTGPDQVVSPTDRMMDYRARVVQLRPSQAA